jgi:hypothetical protein
MLLIKIAAAARLAELLITASHRRGASAYTYTARGGSCAQAFNNARNFFNQFQQNYLLRLPILAARYQAGNRRGNRRRGNFPLPIGSNGRLKRR